MGLEVESKSLVIFEHLKPICFSFFFWKSVCFKRSSHLYDEAVPPENFCVWQLLEKPWENLDLIFIVSDPHKKFWTLILGNLSIILIFFTIVNLFSWFSAEFFSLDYCFSPITEIFVWKDCIAWEPVPCEQFGISSKEGVIWICMGKESM